MWYLMAITMTCSSSNNHRIRISERVSLKINRYRRTTITEMLPASVKPAHVYSGGRRLTDRFGLWNSWLQIEVLVRPGDGDWRNFWRWRRKRSIWIVAVAAPRQVFKNSVEHIISENSSVKVVLFGKKICNCHASYLPPFGFTVTSVSFSTIIESDITISDSDTLDLALSSGSITCSTTQNEQVFVVAHGRRSRHSIFIKCFRWSFGDGWSSNSFGQSWSTSTAAAARHIIYLSLSNSSSYSAG